MKPIIGHRKHIGFGANKIVWSTSEVYSRKMSRDIDEESKLNDMFGKSIIKESNYDYRNYKQ